MRRKRQFLIDIENQLGVKPNKKQGRGLNNKKTSNMNRDFEYIFGQKSLRKSLFFLEEKVVPKKKSAAASKSFDFRT